MTGERPRFEGDLAAVEPLSAASRAAANRLMEDGRLFRYSETGNGIPEAAQLEVEFADWAGSTYCIAVNSGGGALFLALKAADIGPGDRVLLNAFTLAPVPGAIAHAGAEPVLVDITPDLTIDLDDLAAKARSTGAKAMIASHMRGHFGDLDTLAQICAEHGITLIEDCAHAMGARWDGRRVGRFGVMGCFSAQSYKHLNAGEGGFVITDNPDMAARIVIMSGSYMLYPQHRAAPEQDVFDRWDRITPNYSMRMSGLAAAILRPQLADLESRVMRWRHIYAQLARRLSQSDQIRLPTALPGAAPAPTSLQFFLSNLTADQIADCLDRVAGRGVGIKWFGAAAPKGFTSRPAHWSYLGDPRESARIKQILSCLCDIRLPIGLSDGACDLIAEIILDEVSRSHGIG